MPQRPTILISDDEPLLVRTLTHQAEALGLKVIQDTRSEVHALAKSHRPDVIVLDLLQLVDGRDLLSALKQDPETRDVEVVILSGVEDDFARRVCLELGASDFALKPVPPTFLHRLARQVHEGRSGLGSGARQRPR
jgi:two-component system response regulator AdeR